MGKNSLLVQSNRLDSAPASGKDPPMGDASMALAFLHIVLLISYVQSLLQQAPLDGIYTLIFTTMF